MKLIFLKFVLVVVVTVDCRSQFGSDFQHSIIADQPGSWPDDFAPGSSEDTDLMTDGGFFDLNDPEEITENGKALERGSCRTRESCAIRGGYCMDNATACMGKAVPAGCKGRNCVCCLPVCPEGYFQPSGPPTNQCFKLLTDKKRNWNDANSTCKGQGLQLAEPYDAQLLRSYMVQRYGPDARAWLGARGDGSTFIWQREGRVLNNNNPLWLPQKPGNDTTSSYCLEMSAWVYSWKSQPMRPYHPSNCGRSFYALCELIMP